MVIKGGSRAGPKQLAKHLLRTDTNERVTILELHSPIEDLYETFRDWDTLASGTRGTKSLYHANIDPAKDYAMTEAQWLRSVDVLAEHLGLQNQPRAVVMHDKNGRQHIHVVWQRTDVENMKLISDSQNYLAHEKASYQLEREFGHEHVPGKHAKRDREKQPDFPRSEIDHAEWQHKERTGIDPRARKELIGQLYERCDSAYAFKAAVEHEGYMLAKGDRRDFVLVDQFGAIHSLSRQIKGAPAKELRAFMSDIDRAHLPDTTEAQRIQAELAAERAEKELQAEREKAAAEREREERRPHDEQQAPSAPEPEVPQPALSAEERRRFENLLAERQAAELKRLTDGHDAEARKALEALDRELRETMDRFDATQAEERTRFLRTQQAQDRVNATYRQYDPVGADELDLAAQRIREDFDARLRTERQNLFVTLKQERDHGIDELVERQARTLRDEQRRHEEERERHRRDDEATKRALDDLENAVRKNEEDRGRPRDGPDDEPTR